MRSVIVVLLMLGLGGAFILQKRKEASRPPEPAKTSAVSEHDWAKHSLDRAAEVKREVLRQRASNSDH
jgi:hypothetical protein